MFCPGAKPALLFKVPLARDFATAPARGVHMPAIRRDALGRYQSSNPKCGRARLARRRRIEAGILWPVFGMLSATYIGLFGRALGVW
jgi:hypothetical protein